VHKVWKHNPVIKGHFVAVENEVLRQSQELARNDVKLPISEFEWDCMNAIYSIIQQRLWLVPPSDYKNHTEHEIDFVEIKESMKCNSNKYIEDITDTIDKMFKAEIVLKNFIHIEDGKKYKLFKARIIQSYGIDGTNKTKINIVFGEFFLLCMLRRTANFTVIDLNSSRGVKGKYAKPLYELIECNRGFKKSFYLSLEDLNKMFCKDESSLKEHKRILKRILVQNPDMFRLNEALNEKDKILIEI
jgi:hypothetical protein